MRPRRVPCNPSQATATIGPMRSRLLLPVIVVAGLISASACSDSGGVVAMRSNTPDTSTPASDTPTTGGDGPATSGSGAPASSPFGWSDVTSGDDSIQTGHLKVPIDY